MIGKEYMVHVALSVTEEQSALKCINIVLDKELFRMTKEQLESLGFYVKEWYYVHNDSGGVKK